MELPIPKTWKQIWDTWDIRAVIILSLSLQIFLILLAPLRKRISSPWLIMPTWSAYLLADWAANFAAGLIFSNNTSDQKPQQQEEKLLAFWAPFLLVHLGGPDTITAFALEDNELWPRHLFGLVFQSLAAFYIFFQSLPKNKLWVPTMLMFLAGIIKYYERTRSLYLASLGCFRKSMHPGPNNAEVMEEFYRKKEAKVPTSKVKGRINQEWEVILYAHRFFKTFKGLIVDLMCSFQERSKSRDFFLNRTPEDAFRVVEVELNFIYEFLFTKASVIYTTSGYIGRFLSFSCTIISLVLFSSEKKAKFDAFDVGITYMLLGGAIALDLIAFIRLIYSDGFVVATRKLPDAPHKQNTPEAAQQRSPFLNCFGGIRQFFRRRWSESISTFNLINYCLHPRPDVQEGILNFFGITSYLDVFKYVEQKPFTNELRVHIFTELRRKSEIADDLETAKEISAARGEWILRADSYCPSLLRYILEVDYDESLLLWHIATELCYNDEAAQSKSNKYRDFSKLLSDYMMYLLIMQPTMMSAVTGIGKIRFQDTCAEAKRFFHTGNQKMKRGKPKLSQVIRYVVGSIFRYFRLYLYLLVLSVTVVITSPLLIIPQVRGIMQEQGRQYHGRVMEYLGREKESEEELINACKAILKVKTTVVKPVALKGRRSKSVMFDGSTLAKELQNLKQEKWEIMSKVWVELLCYAAIQCRANSLAQELSNGGELITIVCFLMGHLGLGAQFQISKGHAKAKLTVA